MAVLYRKYRPQTFSEVLGQKSVIQTLKNQVASGQPAHAYLFTGSRGVGKTTIARILAKAMNCQNFSDIRRTKETKKKEDGNAKGGDACGRCPVCKQVEQGTFLDLIEIDAASNTGVDNIRELIEHVKFSPSVGTYKVFIIDEVHMLSKGAFNALLKTLEEPPAHAVFILATTEINKVPVTIVPRTQRFDFKRLSFEDLSEHLQKIIKREDWGIDRQILELIARHSDGSVRDALSLLDKVATLGNNPTAEESLQLLGITDVEYCENLLELIADGREGDLSDFFDRLSEKGQDYSIFNRDFLEYLRTVLVFKISPRIKSGYLGEARPGVMEALAGKISLPDLIFIIRLFLRSYKDLAYSPSPEIPLLLAGIEAAAKHAGSKTGIAKKSPQADLTHEDLKNRKNFVLGQDAQDQKKEKETAAELSVEEGDAALFNVSLTEVSDIWQNFIAKIREVNTPLANLIRTSSLLEVRGNAVVVAVKFLFHKQNLENSKNQQLCNRVLEELTGKKIRISAQVEKEAGDEELSQGENLAEAIRVFGGEIVE